jgi:thiol:disulfide interchange protein
VHRPDLLIYGNIKVGLGLWRWIWVSLPLEFILLLIGAWLYARYVPARGYGNAALWVFVACMTGLELYATFGPAPVSPIAEAQVTLVAYVALAAIAGLVDLTRQRGRHAFNLERPAEQPEGLAK